MIDRQKVVGWVLIAFAVAYLVYFLRLRMFEVGPPLQTKEWVQFIGSVVLLMIGTANVRLAAMRARRRKGSD